MYQYDSYLYDFNQYHFEKKIIDTSIIIFNMIYQNDIVQYNFDTIILVQYNFDQNSCSIYIFNMITIRWELPVFLGQFGSSLNHSQETIIPRNSNI